MKTIIKGILWAGGLLFMIQASHAQTNKGAWVVGGSGSFNFSHNGNEATKTTGIRLYPRAGYLVWNNLATGIAPDIYLETDQFANNSPVGEIHSRKIALGPFVRYYFSVLPAVMVFAEGSFAYGRSSTQSNGEGSKYHYHVWRAGPGIAFFLTPSASLNISAAYEQTKATRHYSLKTNGINAAFGFCVYLSGK